MGEKYEHITEWNWAVFVCGCEFVGSLRWKEVKHEIHPVKMDLTTSWISYWFFLKPLVAVSILSSRNLIVNDWKTKCGSNWDTKERVLSANQVELFTLMAKKWWAITASSIGDVQVKYNFPAFHVNEHDWWMTRMENFTTNGINFETQLIGDVVHRKIHKIIIFDPIIGTHVEDSLSHFPVAV